MTVDAPAAGPHHPETVSSKRSRRFWVIAASVVGLVLGAIVMVFPARWALQEYDTSLECDLMNTERRDNGQPQIPCP